MSSEEIRDIEQGRCMIRIVGANLERGTKNSDSIDEVKVQIQATRALLLEADQTIPCVTTKMD